MLSEKVLGGVPVDDIFIFDCHGHLGRFNSNGTRANSAQSLLRTMDMLGVDCICLSSSEGICADGEYGNELVADAVRQYRGRIYGYAVVTPGITTDADMDRYIKTDGFLGLKVHAYYRSCAVNAPGYDVGYAYADRHGLPVLIHTWSADEVRGAADVADRYRNAKIIIAHSAFTGYSAKLEVISALKKYDNVYADTTVSLTYDGSVEWIVDKTGPDKLLYGSDMACFDCRQEFGRIMLSNISDADKEKIMGQNAKKLFCL